MKIPGIESNRKKIPRTLDAEIHCGREVWGVSIEEKGWKGETETGRAGLGGQ
jgi:hypothetical protein